METSGPNESDLSEDLTAKLIIPLRSFKTVLSLLSYCVLNLFSFLNTLSRKELSEVIFDVLIQRVDEDINLSPGFCIQQMLSAGTCSTPAPPTKTADTYPKHQLHGDETVQA